MTRSRKSAVLFDLDGTLVDLVAVDIDAARAELAGLFEPLGYRGGFVPVLPGIAAAARAVAATPAEKQALFARGRAVLDRAEAAASVIVRPGVVAIVGALASRGVPMALFTDNGRAVAERACVALGIEGCLVISRDDVARGKPDPEGVERAAGFLLPAGGCLWVLGDSERDMAAACAARQALPAVDLRAIAVTGGRSTAAELAAAGADVVLASLADLAGLDPDIFAG